MIWTTNLETLEEEKLEYCWSIERGIQGIELDFWINGFTMGSGCEGT